MVMFWKAGAHRQMGGSRTWVTKIVTVSVLLKRMTRIMMMRKRIINMEKYMRICYQEMRYASHLLVAWVLVLLIQYLFIFRLYTFVF